MDAIQYVGNQYAGAGTIPPQLYYLRRMAKKQLSNYIQKTKVHRPNVHAKTKTSNRKTSKFYQKKYRGQGR